MPITDNRNHDLKQNDAFSSMALAKKLEKDIRDSLGKNIAIGLFGAYGEGKSTIVSELKDQLLDADKKKNIGLLEIDAWKYDVKEIESSLYEIYNLEKDMESVGGTIKQTGFMVARQLSPRIHGMTINTKIPTSLTSNYADTQLNLHKDVGEGLKYVWRKLWDSNVLAGGVKVICFENLDRCTIDKKIEVLASIHKLQDWFTVPVLVAIDPHSVDTQKKYFEDLIKKVFITSYYIERKTKTQLQAYMQGKEEIDDTLSAYILSIYPVSPRDINYIANIYDNKKDNNDNVEHHKSHALMAILHAEYRELYHFISINPFYLNYYINQAQKNHDKNYYEDLNYTYEDAVKINTLFLHYYRSFGSFSIYDVFDVIAPLMSVNKTERIFLKEKEHLVNITDNILYIVDLLLKAQNYYEVKKMFKMCSYRDNKELLKKENIKKLFLESFKYKAMIEVLFLDANYTTCTRNINFEETEVRSILNASSNILHKSQNMNLAKFILGMIDEDKQKLYKKEFSAIFSSNINLFLAFFSFLRARSLKRLSNFIYDVIEDEIHQLVIKLDIDRGLDFYIFFTEAYSFIIDGEKLSDIEYSDYISKLFNRILEDKIFIDNTISNNLLHRYIELLSKIEQKIDFKRYTLLLERISELHTNSTDKIQVYYQIYINTLDSDEEIYKDFFEEFSYLLLEGTSSEDCMDDIVKVLADESLMMHRYFESHKRIMKEIVKNIMDKMVLSKHHKVLVEGFVNTLLYYMDDEDYSQIYEKFTLNALGVQILQNSIHDENLYKFTMYLYNEKQLDIWKEYDNVVTKSLLVEVANYSEDIKYIDNKTAFSLIFKELDFKKVQLKPLTKHLKGIDKEALYIFTQKIDNYLLGNELESLENFIKEELQEDTRLKSKLIEERLAYAYSKGNVKFMEIFYDVIFGLYLHEEKSVWYVTLANNLQSYIKLYSIKSENMLKVIENW